MAAQALCGAGSLGHHLRLMTKTSISDSAVIAQRLQLPWEFFEQLLARVLQPLCKPRTQPGAFYHGLRLLGVDGTCWSLRNTAAVLAVNDRRHGNQRGASAAFIKLNSAVLLELGSHQPLALACDSLQGGSVQHEGELTIARRTLPALRQAGPSLLLADRLYGCASFILDVRQASEGRAHLLLRMRSHYHGEVLKVLGDGSTLLNVAVRPPRASQARARAAGKRLPVQQVQVREVRAEVQRGGEPAFEMRLWTTLLDERQHPARELMALYAQRWEQELFYRELKHHVAGGSLLKAASVAAAQAELAGLILAASLVARRRVQAAEAVELPPVRLSLLKIGRMLGSLSLMLYSAEGILSEQQCKALSRRMLKAMAKEAVIPPRKNRRCERGLRRSVMPWPVIKSRSKLDAALSITLLRPS